MSDAVKHPSTLTSKPALSRLLVLALATLTIAVAIPVCLRIKIISDVERYRTEAEQRDANLRESLKPVFEQGAQWSLWEQAEARRIARFPLLYDAGITPGIGYSDRCPRCDGRGVNLIDFPGDRNGRITVKECPSCRGTGLKPW